MTGMPPAHDPLSSRLSESAGQVPDDGLPVGWAPRDMVEDGDPVSRSDEEWIGARDLGQWRTAAGREVVALLERLWDRGGDVVRWALAHLTLVLTAAIGGAVMLVFNAGAAEVYEAVADNEGVAALDQPVLDQAVALRTPESNVWVTHFTDLGGKTWSPVLAVVLTLVLWALWRRWTPLLVMAIGTLGSTLMTVLGKELVGRTRPPLQLAVPPYEYSASFPSGHTLNTTVIVGLTAYLLLFRIHSKRGRAAVITAAILFAGAMGLSRVYLGHHWLTDVMAGWLLGLGWIFTVITAHRLWVTVRRHRHAPATQS